MRCQGKKFTKKQSEEMTARRKRGLKLSCQRFLARFNTTREENIEASRPFIIPNQEKVYYGQD
jgi:hypothetical protein